MKYNINKMTLKEKLGQMIILGLDVSKVNNNILKLIKDYHIGGVVLYKKNYQDVSSMINLINQIKTTSTNDIPIFIAIDQENGLVNRFPNEIMPIPSPRQQVAKNIVNDCNTLTIEIMHQLGINMNLAPVLDVDRNQNSTINGTRSYSTNYQEVIKYGNDTIKQYQENNIIPVGKHFPGHGLAKGDSHFIIPIIKDLHTLNQEDYQVFKNTINNGLETIMLGHLRIKGYGFKPITMNKKIIKDYLSDYQGLLMTDDIQMNYLKYLYGSKKVFLNCLTSGNHLIMIKYYHNIEKLFTKLLISIDSNKEILTHINESVEKILTIKEKYHLTNDQIINNLDIPKINNKISKIITQ